MPQFSAHVGVASNGLRYFAKPNEMKLCEMVLCEMVLCETVFCEMVFCEMVLLRNGTLRNGTLQNGLLIPSLWVRSIGKSGFRFRISDFGFPNKTRNPKMDFDQPKSFSKTDFN